MRIQSNDSMHAGRFYARRFLRSDKLHEMVSDGMLEVVGEEAAKERQ